MSEMNQFRAIQILSKMARERYSSTEKVLQEFAKYEKNGECQHFWPDENTACKLVLNQKN